MMCLLLTSGLLAAQAMGMANPVMGGAGGMGMGVLPNFGMGVAMPAAQAGMLGSGSGRNVQSLGGIGGSPFPGSSFPNGSLM